MWAWILYKLLFQIYAITQIILVQEHNKWSDDEKFIVYIN